MRAVTKPISISKLSFQYKIDESKLFKMIEKVINLSQIKGSLNQGLYVPESFGKLQI